MSSRSTQKMDHIRLTYWKNNLLPLSVKKFLKHVSRIQLPESAPLAKGDKQRYYGIH